uniref:VPS13_C domain-containing protein n=1 Tax=Macrostomum lignano TaxID=282301 RepID=A0A1I8FIC4_9PLAT
KWPPAGRDEALTDVTLIAYADSGSDAAGSGSALGNSLRLRNCSKTATGCVSLRCSQFPSVLMHQEFLGLSIDELVGIVDSDELKSSQRISRIRGHFEMVRLGSCATSADYSPELCQTVTPVPAAARLTWLIASNLNPSFRDGHLKTTSSVICANLSGSGGGPARPGALASWLALSYAIGGHVVGPILNTVEGWTPGPSLGLMSTVGVAALHGRLYAVCASRDGSSCLKTPAAGLSARHLYKTAARWRRSLRARLTHIYAVVVTTPRVRIPSAETIRIAWNATTTHRPMDFAGFAKLLSKRERARVRRALGSLPCRL